MNKRLMMQIIIFVIVIILFALIRSASGGINSSISVNNSLSTPYANSKRVITIEVPEAEYGDILQFVEFEIYCKLEGTVDLINLSDYYGFAGVSYGSMINIKYPFYHDMLLFPSDIGYAQMEGYRHEEELYFDTFSYINFSLSNNLWRYAPGDTFDIFVENMSYSYIYGGDNLSAIITHEPLIIDINMTYHYWNPIPEPSSISLLSMALITLLRKKS